MKPVWFGPGDLAWMEPETEEEREQMELVRRQLLDNATLGSREVLDRSD